MPRTRPRWFDGFRKRVIAEQGGKCAGCGERITPETSELHHDFRGEGWASINHVADEVLPALGFDAESIARFKRETYHHRASVEALHPSCHIKADRAMLQGRLTRERMRKL